MPYYANPQIEKINSKASYSLNALAEIFDCRSGTLRIEIAEERLKARKRGRTWMVVGKDAIAWWNKY